MKYGKWLIPVGIIVLVGVVVVAFKRSGDEVELVPSQEQVRVTDVPAIKQEDGGVAMNYLDYSRSAYQQARNEGKVILIYFYANWCPTCRAQQPANEAAFAQLAKDGEVVIFVSNFNDSEETGEDKALQKEFDIPYQHTFLVINSAGEVVYKYTGQLTAEQIVKEVLAAKKLIIKKEE